MAASLMLRIQRVSVTAGVKSAITPIASFQNVTVGNATKDALEFHTTEDSDLEYLVIDAGFERTFQTARRLFGHDKVAFWLKPVVSGTVVLLWY